MHGTTVPFAFSLTTLAERLASLTDQRKRRGKRFPLVPLLLTAVLAKLAGHPCLEDLSDWEHLRAADLTALFDPSRSTMPHQATWSRIFAHAIDLAEFEARLTTFFQAQRQSTEVPERGSIVLALDGKTLRIWRKSSSSNVAGGRQGRALRGALWAHQPATRGSIAGRPAADCASGVGHRERLTSPARCDVGGRRLSAAARAAPQTNAALNNLVVSLVLSSGKTNLAAAQRQFAYLIDRSFTRAAFAAGQL